MILETTFLIDFMQGKAAATAKLSELEKQDEPLMVAAPTIHELWRGIIALEKSAQQHRLKALLQSVIVLAMDAQTAERSGKIEGMLIKQGNTIEVEDCMIAGIALHHDHPILTRDKDFRLIEGLEVISY